jgi:hypothetical protein
VFEQLLKKINLAPPQADDTINPFFSGSRVVRTCSSVLLSKCITQRASQVTTCSNRSFSFTMSDRVNWYDMQRLTRRLGCSFNDPWLVPQPPTIPSIGLGWPRPYRDPLHTPQIRCFIPWCWFITLHVVSQCPIFREELEAQDRAELLKSQGRYFCCWKVTYNPANPRSHNSKNCSEPRGCEWCRAPNHQTLLHGAKHCTLKKASE